MLILLVLCEVSVKECWNTNFYEVVILSSILLSIYFSGPQTKHLGTSKSQREICLFYSVCAWKTFSLSLSLKTEITGMFMLIFVCIKMFLIRLLLGAVW